MNTPYTSLLSRDRVALAVIDMQESFRRIIPDFDAVAERIAKAVQGAALLKVPIVVTEQYPRGLKRTAIEIATHLNGAPVLEKTCFSSVGADGFAEHLESRDVRQVLLCGIEAHICVTQTTLDLLSRGFEVHLLIDCITSRDPRSGTYSAVDFSRSSTPLPALRPWRNTHVASVSSDVGIGN